jgi:YVTN family beta-propeller protein
MSRDIGGRSSVELARVTARSRPNWEGVDGYGIGRLLATAASAVAGILGSTQTFAQSAYITNARSTVSVIDTVTNTVVGSIPVGYIPRGVAVTPDGSKVFVTNAADNSVSVISTATNTVVAVPPGRHRADWVWRIYPAEVCWDARE